MKTIKLNNNILESSLPVFLLAAVTLRQSHPAQPLFPSIGRKGKEVTEKQKTYTQLMTEK